MGEFGLTEMMPEMGVFPMDYYCSNSCSSSGFERVASDRLVNG